MKSPSKDFLFLSLCVIVGAALRLDFLYASQMIIDADEAIVGLMAKHINEGQPVPIFYYGQHYMGSLEAICVAGLFAAFGVSSMALKLVPLLFSLVLIVLMFELGKRLGGKFVAYSAAALTAVPPSALVVWSSMARGGFIEVIVLGAAALLAAIKWFQAPTHPIKHLLICSFLLGIGWWVNNQIVYFFVPIGLLVLLLFRRTPRSASQWPAAFVAFLIGSLPFWYYNITNQYKSFGLFQRSSIKDSFDHLLGVFSVALPIILGAKKFWQEDHNFTWIDSSILILSVAMVAVFIAARWKQLLSLLWLGQRKSEPVELMLVMLLGAIGIFSISSFGWLVQAPRYLLPLYVPWLLLLAWTAKQLARENRYIGSLIVLVFAVFHLCSSYFGGRAIPGQPYIFASDRVALDNTELIKWLDENNVHWVRTNYWVGYRLAFETEERVRFLVTQEPFQTRIPEWETEGSKIPDDQIPYILSSTQARLLRKALQILDYSFHEISKSGYTVLYKVRPPEKNLVPLSDDNFHLESELNKDLLPYATDNDPETRWGSGTAQRPGMSVEIVFNQPTSARALGYSLSHWATDYPRGLAVSYQNADGTWDKIFGGEDWPAVRYLFENCSKLTFYLPGTPIKRIRLEETGSDPVFDWSIADLQAFK